MRTGVWMERLDDVKETEDLLAQESERSERVGS